MKVWLVSDMLGRAILGKAEDVSEDSHTVKLIDPIIVNEVQVSQNQLQLRFLPIFHTYDLRELTIKWSILYEADEKMTNDYEDFMSKIRAKRSGIEVPSSVPMRGA